MERFRIFFDCNNVCVEDFMIYYGGIVKDREWLSSWVGGGKMG